VDHAISDNDVGNCNGDKAVDLDDNNTGEPRYINAEMVVVEKGWQIDMSGPTGQARILGFILGIRVQRVVEHDVVLK